MKKPESRTCALSVMAFCASSALAMDVPAARLVAVIALCTAALAFFSAHAADRLAQESKKLRRLHKDDNLLHLRAISSPSDSKQCAASAYIEFSVAFFVIACTLEVCL